MVQRKGITERNLYITTDQGQKPYQLPILKGRSRKSGRAIGGSLVLVAGERGRCTEEGRGSDEGSSLEGAI